MLTHKEWVENVLPELSKMSDREMACRCAEVIGDASIDVDKPFQDFITQFCDTVQVSKDRRDFYAKITSVRAKRIYAITTGGAVQLYKVSKESLIQLTVTPLNTEVKYMPINDVLSAEGYDALATMKRDAIADLDLGEIERFFAVLDAAVPAANVFNMVDGGSNATGFTYKVLRKMRSAVKDYASKFVLLTGSHVDDEIMDWDYDENKYRSIHDMVKDLGVEIQYVGEYNLVKAGVDTAVIDPDTAYLVANPDRLDGKAFVFARKLITNVGFADAEKDSVKQRVVQMIPAIVNIANVQTAVMGYWGYSENSVVCRCPLALAKYVKE